MDELYDLYELYQEVILDHNKNPRNFMVLENANRHAEGYNPLCGDQITVYLHINDGKVEGITFQGSGCAISKASASIMTSSIKGKTETETEALFAKVHKMLTDDGAINLEEMGKLAVLSGIKQFPVRVKCATLPWHTMKAALESKKEKVSTELG